MINHECASVHALYKYVTCNALEESIWEVPPFTGSKYCIKGKCGMKNAGPSLAQSSAVTTS